MLKLDLAGETLALHNLLEHVALVLVELDSRHSEYVVLQAVSASTKTKLIMLSFDDHLEHEALDIDQTSMVSVHGTQQRRERTEQAGAGRRAMLVAWC